MNRKRLIPIAIAAAMVVLAACSNSGDGGSGSGSGSGSESAGAPQAAVDALARYTDTAALEYPGPPEDGFTPGRHKVAIISCAQAGVGCAQMADFAKDAAQAAGWKTSEILDGKFDPTVQGGYVEQAVNEGYDAIILTAIDPQAMSAAISAAKAAGIPVGCVMCETEGFEGAVYDATTGGYAGGEAMAAYASVRLEGKGKVVGFLDKAFPIVITRLQGVHDGIEKYCPECSYDEEAFSAADLAKPGPPSWTAFLNANPAGSVDLVIGPYDNMSLPAAKSSAQAGRTDPLVTGLDAIPESVSAIQTGNPAPLVASIASPTEYAAWSAFDLVARVVAGADTWDATGLPVAVVTKDNASEFTDGYLKTPFDVAERFTAGWGQ